MLATMQMRIYFILFYFYISFFLSENKKYIKKKSFITLDLSRVLGTSFLTCTAKFKQVMSYVSSFTTGARRI